jgi:hypothetical protein
MMNGKSLGKLSRVRFCHCEGLYDRHENPLYRFTLHLIFALPLIPYNKNDYHSYIKNKCYAMIVHVFLLLAIIWDSFLKIPILIFHKHYHYNNY